MKKIIIAGLISLAFLGGCSKPDTSEPNPSVSSASPIVTASPSITASDAPTGDPSGPATEFPRNERAYIDDVRVRGVASALEDQAIVDIGDDVCNEYDQGLSTNEILSNLIGSGLDSVDAGNLTYSAVTFLCPKHRAQAERETS